MPLTTSLAAGWIGTAEYAAAHAAAATTRSDGRVMMMIWDEKEAATFAMNGFLLVAADRQFLNSSIALWLLHFDLGMARARRVENKVSNVRSC